MMDARSKTCAICRGTVGSNLLKCPACGSGVFQTEKMHRSHFSSRDNLESEEYSDRGRRRWWRFGSAPIRKADEMDLFSSRLRNHLQRIRSLGDPYSFVIDTYFPDKVVTMLAANTAAKMALTQSDTSEHSFAISDAPICYQVCTLRLSVRKARRWFIRAYGGYSKLLEHSWNSEYFTAAGCEILAHMVYGRVRKNAWVNMTLWPLSSNPAFSFKPIVPVDLLTENEV